METEDRPWCVVLSLPIVQPGVLPRLAVWRRSCEIRDLRKPLRKQQWQRACQGSVGVGGDRHGTQFVICDQQMHTSQHPLAHNVGACVTVCCDSPFNCQSSHLICDWASEQLI